MGGGWLENEYPVARGRVFIPMPFRLVDYGTMTAAHRLGDHPFGEPG